MKRLVILTLVLGLATAANAHLQLTLNNSTTQSVAYIRPGWHQYVQVGIYKDDTVAENIFIDYDLAADIGVKYNLFNVALTANAGDTSWIDSGSFSGTTWEYYGYIQNSTGFSSPPGQVFNSIIRDTGQYWYCAVNIYLWDNSGENIIDTATIYIVPEPATLLLLGLGGLMLKKRI